MRTLCLLCLIFVLATSGSAMPPSAEALRTEIDRYLEPYVATGNFSGSIVVAREGEILVSAAYGYANLEHSVPNSPKSVYYLASISRIFTCAAALVLEQEGKLKTSDPVSRHLPGYPNGDRITVHHLLTGSSGLPNINRLDGYDEWEQFPQTASSLVEKFRDLPLTFEPGERSVHSNSNYVLLALLIETLSGQSFGDFLREKLFEPAGMASTAHDGDRARLVPHRATGYAPSSSGRSGLVNARTIDWTVKTGNASIYSTAEDLYRFDRTLERGSVLSRESVRKTFTDHIDANGYGWFVRERLGSPEGYISGRSPGYGGYWGRSLDHGVTVIVLGNIYNSLSSAIGRALIAMTLGEPYEPARFRATRLGSEALAPLVGSYQFGDDYYNPNYLMVLREEDGDLYTPWAWLMPAEEGKFIDRLYGGDVEFRRDANGRVEAMVYDGFVGKRLPVEPGGG